MMIITCYVGIWFRDTHLLLAIHGLKTYRIKAELHVGMVGWFVHLVTGQALWRGP